MAGDAGAGDRCLANVAVFVGPGAMGAWQKREVELALDRQARDATLLVVPVLLPNAEPPLGFLRLLTPAGKRESMTPVTIEILARRKFEESRVTRLA